MNTLSIISGTDLIKYKHMLDLDPQVAKQLDPDGYNLINMEFMHNDDVNELRLVMMFKLINREGPVDGTLTIGRNLLDKIRKQWPIEEENV